jgi:hypothetical protein
VIAIDWQSILTSFGGNAALLLALAFLIKTVISSRLSQEADAFRIQLRAQADVEIERLKSALQVAATEHQVRFAKLHEKRAEVIAELYRLLLDVPTSALKFILTDMRDPTQAENAHKKVFELYSFISLNRIYLPGSVCGLLDNFEGKLRHSVTFVEIYWTRIENPSPETVKQQNKVMLEACQALETDLPAIRKELETEFRILLGVEVPQRT